MSRVEISVRLTLLFSGRGLLRSAEKAFFGKENKEKAEFWASFMSDQK
jgi:hypothetical protein